MRILWTQTAKDGLARLPPKVRRGLLDKASELYECTDPRRAHKPLTGPLQGCYRITCGRYRAIYTIAKEQPETGGITVRITILFVAAGIRKERSRDDIYRIAQRLMQFNLIGPDRSPSDANDKSSD